MKIPLLKGRHFTPQDREGTLPVVIVNETFVRRSWPGQEALGKRIRVGPTNAPWRTIVGITRDVTRGDLETSSSAAEFNLPYAQYPGELHSMNVAVRTAGRPSNLLNSVREAVLAVDPDQPAPDL
jgi:hypothetical protein